MSTRIRFPAVLNTRAKLDFVLDFNEAFTEEAAKDPFLDAGETIADYAIVLSAQAVAMGLEVGDVGGSFPPAETAPGELTVWLSIASDRRDDPLFRTGVVLEFYAKVTTDSAPARTKIAVFEVVVQS